MEHIKDIRMAKNFREIAVLASCDHPNIVRYFDCFSHEDELWVTMEYLEGGSLEDLQELNTFEEEHIAYIAREVRIYFLFIIL